MTASRPGAELFGSGTRKADGRHAHDGFEDSNGDGRISAADERFDELVLWSDVDRDKQVNENGATNRPAASAGSATAGA